MTKPRDLYEVLGVKRDVSESGLKKAYRELAKKSHPDVCPGDKTAEERFKELANAYQVLSDPKLRANYDRYGMDGVRPGGGAGPDPAAASGGRPPGGFSSVDDIFSTFGDLFSDFFTGQKGGGSERGSDVRVDLEITFTESVWGAARDISFSRSAVCSTCKGIGDVGGRATLCARCQGRGQVVHSQGFFAVQTTCPQCQGRGRSAGTPCRNCDRGMREEHQEVTVTIPAGVADGQALRVSGKGDVGTGGTSGDLYVHLIVSRSSKFERVDYDVISEVPISFFQAALGGEVDVPTLDDDCDGTATIEVGSGTQFGDEFVRRGQGIPHVNGRGRGDHIVRFAVEIPRRLSARQEKFLREIAAEFDQGRERKTRSRKTS